MSLACHGMQHALVIDEATTSPKWCMSSLVVPLRDYFTIYTPKFLNMLTSNVLSFWILGPSQEMISTPGSFYFELTWANKNHDNSTERTKELEQIYTSKIQVQLILVQRSLLRCTAIKSKSGDRKKHELSVYLRICTINGFLR